MSYLSSLGANATIIDVYRQYPAMARHLLGLAHEALAVTDEFTPGECEMIGAYVSALNNCGYCRRVHTEAAIAAGVDRSLFEGYAAGNAPQYGGPRWKPVFDYVRDLTLTSSAISKSHIDLLLEAGWSEPAIVQLVAICSAFAVLNRFANGLGLTANDDFFTDAGFRLATEGYAAAAATLESEI